LLRSRASDARQEATSNFIHTGPTSECILAAEDSIEIKRKKMAVNAIKPKLLGRELRIRQHFTASHELPITHTNEVQAIKQAYDSSLSHRRQIQVSFDGARGIACGVNFVRAWRMMLS
jgi:hypothetical protein